MILKLREKLYGVNLTSYERKNYPMPKKEDFAILNKIRELEKRKLLLRDKEVVKLIRTQLEKNWRASLVKSLNKLLKKYEK
ncbi:MAG: hypothetical protein KKC19_04345 [Nanoarchaeota archaeon]|nr:hypothetical protein [Nanoarchaeota archaeon]